MSQAQSSELKRLAKTIPIGGVKIALKDVAAIFERLSLQVQEQAEIDTSQLVKVATQSQEDFENEIKGLRREVYKVTAFITGRDGSSLTAESSAVFADTANLPDKIASILVSNTPAFQRRLGTQPANSFALNFDFNIPPLFEFSTALSAPTSNNTNLQVQGNRASWVAGVQAAVQSITSERRTQRTWLHRAFIYDAGLMLIGVPVALYTCWKLSPLIDKHVAPMGAFATAFVYLYASVLIIWVYRGFFGYAKWAFPYVELTDNADRSGKHRATLGAVVLALAANVVWEVLKLI